MQKHPDLKWVHQPALWLLNEEQAVIETEPFTGLFSGGLKPAAELCFDVDDVFTFSVCIQHTFTSSFDECGLILSNGGRRIVVAGICAHDDMTNQLRCTVFHNKHGDICVRDLGVRLNRLYYRIYCRKNMVSIQYSFNGDMYKELRKFWLEKPAEKKIGLYACSPLNSSFDAVFSRMQLEEGE